MISDEKALKVTLSNKSCRYKPKTTMNVLKIQFCGWSHGVMVSTLNSESSDPSSNLSGTWVQVS